MRRLALLLMLALVPSAPGASQEEGPLGIEDLLEQVERNYPKLLGADIERQVAGAKFLEKQGAFDPTLSFKSEELEFQDGSSDTTKRKNQLVFEVPTRAGIKWFAGARLTDTTVAGKKGTKDFERGFVGMEIPLIRNARWNAKLAAERQAALGRPRAEAELRRIQLELLRKAGETYWEWVAAARARAVAEEMVQLARLRAEALIEQADRGDKPELVAVEAEREVQKRLGILAKADRNVQKAGLKLSLFLWDDAGEPSDPPSPDSAPPAFPPPGGLSDTDLAAAEARAMELRPELGALDLERQITDIDLSLARNDGRPDLKLFFNPGRESDLDVFEPIERRLRAGVKLSIPLRRRAPRGRAKAARLKLDKLQLEATLLRRRILTEVRDAASRIRTDRERYRAAERELELARRLEEGERTRFELGEGTLFLVNQRERSRAEAEIKRLAVAADYHQARLAFRAITGAL